MKKLGVKFWGLVLVLAVCSQSAAQNQYKPDYDTTHILDFRHRLNLSFVTEFKQNTINVLNYNQNNLNYHTNQPMPNYGVMLSYRWLNFSVSVPLPGLSYAPPEYGETKSLALALGFTGRNWYLRNFYERFDGYYLSNASSHPHYFPYTDTIPLHPKMSSKTYLATIYYGLNGYKYSHRALMWQSEFQKKSAGSVLIGGTGGYKWISSPEPIFTSDELLQSIHAIQYYVIGASAGYSYTFVIGKSINISTMLVPGVSFMSGRFSSHLTPRQDFQDGWGVTGEGRVQFLYTTNRFYVGTSFTGYILTTFVNKETPVGSSHTYLKFNVGYRFTMKPIKFLKPFGLSN